MAALTTARGAEPSTPPVALTLDSALQLALENSAVLRAAGGRVEAAAGRVTQSKTWSNPELELVIEDWPLRKNRGYADAKRTIGLSQAVPFPGKRSLSKQIGVAGVKLSTADLALRRVELVREVKLGYFRVLVLERQVEVSAQLLAMADASVAMARKRSDAGAAAYQEQLRAEVLAEQARVEKGDLELERSAARQTFAVLLGRPDLSGARLTDSLIETPAVSLLADFTAGSLAAHPGLQAAQMNLERAELDQRRARLEPYPDLKVGVAAGEVGETGESIGQVSFSLPLPLFDRGKGTRQEARANIVVATAELHAVQQELQRDVTNAVGRYRMASEHVDNYRTRILPKADEALRLVQAGYEEGKFGFADLVDTQRTTAEVQMTYLTKLFEMSAARAELEALVATPTPKS